jgi:hypothetical protein
MLDFDVDAIRKNKIELLDCQVDLILKSLEMYAYMYKYVYPRTKDCLTLEENLRVSLVTGTYEQIANQFGISKKNNIIQNTDNSTKKENEQKNNEKIS